METLFIIIGFIIGLFAVIKGGDWFVDSAVWFSKIFGVPQVIIGATIVSVGTTLPETMISSLAALEGNGNIVLGTSLGSILCNTGLILALNVIVRPSHITESDTFFKLGTMAGVLGLLGLLSLDGMIQRIDASILFILLIVYIMINIYTSKNGEKVEKLTYTKQELAKHIGYFLIGLMMVVLGARILLDSGLAFAHLLNISEVIIAATMFAIGSSLPELVTSITAALKGYKGLFLGNILGANTLNIIMVIGISGTLQPFSVDQQILNTQIPFALILMLILIGPAFITKKISRLQGTIAFFIYLAALITIFIQN